MKLKSLLLGSAAALALSTGAQAADPMAEFVSLDVCDAYGISGLTIASDDTCLKIAGEVEFDYWYEGGDLDNDGTDGDVNRAAFVDWFLSFEATTQTDAGKAVAFVRIGQDSDTLVSDGVDFEEAYVSFGDTTVLKAGLTGSLFGLAENQFILSDTSIGANAGGPDDSHVIQVVSDLGNGWSVGGAVEALAENGDTAGELSPFTQEGGRAGVVVGYDDGTTVANIGAYAYDLYATIDTTADLWWDVYADVASSFGSFDVYADAVVGYGDQTAGVVHGGADDTMYFNGQVSAQGNFDIATVRAGFGLMWDDFSSTTTWRAGAGVMFALTDTVDLDVAVIYNDENPKLDDYFNTYPLASDFEVIHGILTLSAGVTDTLSAEAWATVSHDTNADTTGFGGGAGLTYEPGGNLTLDGGVAAFYDDNLDSTDYAVHFGAVKSF